MINAVITPNRNMCTNCFGLNWYLNCNSFTVTTGIFIASASEFDHSCNDRFRAADCFERKVLSKIMSL